MKFKKIFALFIYSLLTSAYCSSQSWQWARHFGNASGTLCLDSSGNNYLTGNLGLKGIFGSDTIQANGQWGDAFVTKIDKDGNFIWTKQVGGNESLIQTGEQGNDIVYENSTNSIIFCGNMNTLSATIGTCNVGSGDLFFISKLDTSGNCVWAQPFTMPSASSGGPTRIAVDNNGYVYMIGSISKQMSFCNTTIQPGGFLAKFNSLNGACVWAKKISESSGGAGSICLYNNKLYLGGFSANDTLKLDTATAYCYVNDIFISEFDTAGNVQWVKTMGGPNSDGSRSISLDGSGNIYVTGLFKDTAYFGTAMLSNGTNKDWFLAKYSNTGNFIWVRQAHITGNIYNDYSVSSDVAGNVYVSGGFSGTAVFGTYTVTATTPTDLFVVRYDNNGNCIGVVQTGNHQFGVGPVISNKTGGFYVAGEFADTTSFGSYVLPNYDGGTDVFVARHDALTGITEESRLTNNQLLIFANPTAGKCNITVPYEFIHEKDLVLSIYDNTGKLVQQQKMDMSGERIKINLEQEAKGMYHAVLSNGRESYNGKIIFE